MSAEVSKLIIAPSPMGLVCGMLNHITDSEITINKPRSIQATQGPKGGVMLSIIPLIGNPSTLILPKGCWWDCEDAEFKRHYLEETTGLSLATSIPRGKEKLN